MLFEYQICRLNGAGAVVNSTYARCKTDDEARVSARRISAPYGEVEIWEGTRFVGRVSTTLPGSLAQVPPHRHDPLGDHFLS